MAEHSTHYFVVHPGPFGPVSSPLEPWWLGCSCGLHRPPGLRAVAGSAGGAASTAVMAGIRRGPATTPWTPARRTLEGL